MSDRDTRDLGLTSDSFMSGFGQELPQRCVCIAMADQKVGKTRWSLTAPDPIIIFNFDQGLEGVVEPFLKKKQIIVAGMPGSAGRSGKYPSYHFARPPLGANEKGRKDELYLERVKKAAVPIWNRFMGDYREALESKARTLVIDTGGAAFQLGKFAFHGMDKVKSEDDPYGQKGGELKSIFQGIMTDGYNYDKNVIWLHRTKEKWSGGKPIGVFEPEGYNRAQFEVQFTLHLRKKVRKYKNETEVMRWAELVDARMQLHVGEGTSWGEDDDRPMMTFPEIMADIFGTDAAEWK